MTRLQNTKNGYTDNFKAAAAGSKPWENTDLETADTTLFNFDGALIRMIVIGGVPWFLAADVCRALKLATAKGVGTAMRKLRDHEKRRINRAQFFSNHPSKIDGWDVEDNSPTVWFISESGLYFLAMRCQGAATEGAVAYRFRVWLTEEVVPAIRATGSYSAKTLPSDLLAAQLMEPGRYVVIVSPEKAPNVRRTQLDIAFDDRTLFNAELLVHKIRAIGCLWDHLKIIRLSGAASSETKVFGQLGAAIEDGRKLAEDWLETLFAPIE